MRRLIFAVVGLAAIISCSRQEITPTDFGTVKSNSVIATAADFECGDNTKTNITQSGNNPPAFAWKEGDVIGVIPMNNETVQSNYKVGEIGSDPKKALFDGGAWALKEGKSYAAYYPYQKIPALSGGNLTFSFLGQTQSANNSLAHIGAYDYMYASAVIPQSGNAQFNFTHLISLVRIQITVPQAGTFTKLTLESTADWFANTAVMKLSDGTMTAKETAKKVTINLDDIEMAANGVLTVWFAMLPTTALSGKTLSVALYGNDDTVVGSLTGFNAISAGNAYSYACTLSSSQMEYVDLGLSVKWATNNIGASKPEEYGDYYAWGEIEPQTEYSWATYKHCNGTSTSMKKYCLDSEFGQVDGKTTLEAPDDIASTSLGDKWRIPTISEWKELHTKCSWNWTTINGVRGANIVGSNGNSIFLPAGGCYRDSQFYPNGGSYWSSTMGSNNIPYNVDYDSGGAYFDNKSPHYRYSGLSVRPVYVDIVSVTDVSLSNSSLSLSVGGTSTLTATVSPSTATNKNVTWSSSNTSVATVSNGTVTAVAAGTATITVKTLDGSKTATCKVTVTQPVTGVSLNKTSLSLGAGSTSTLIATVSPSTATNKNVTWSSSNTSVATVSNGTVTAVAAGTATITVKTSDGSKTATCTVTVTSVSLNKNSLSLEMASSATLTATVLPADAADKTVKWKSSNKEVVTVEDGVITPIGTGYAFVIASNNGASDTCTVTVNDFQLQTTGFVDMGLSVKWAAYNVGAYSPEQYGDYYAWGEGENTIGTRYNFDWDHYELGSGTAQNPKVTKYNTNSSYGTVDNLTSLGTRDDVAWVLDGDCRMPTSSQAQELITNCTWTFTKYKNVPGYLVKSNRNGAKLFLPSAGYIHDYNSNGTSEYYCCYWTTDVDTTEPVRAVVMDAYDGAYEPGTGHSIMRCYGLPIRAVENNK